MRRTLKSLLYCLRVWIKDLNFLIDDWLRSGSSPETKALTDTPIANATALTYKNNTSSAQQDKQKEKTDE